MINLLAKVILTLSLSITPLFADTKNPALEPVAEPVIVFPEKQPVAVNIVTPENIFNDGSFWDKFIGLLREHPRSVDVINLYVNGNGGDAAITLTIVQAMQAFIKDGGKINVIVSGVAISAHALLSCNGSSITLTEGSSLIFHGIGDFESYFYGMFIQRNLSTNIAAKSLEYTMLQNCLKNGILTKEAVSIISSGKMITYTNFGGLVIASVTDDFYNGWISVLSQIGYLVFLIGCLFIGIGIAKRV